VEINKGFICSEFCNHGGDFVFLDLIDAVIDCLVIKNRTFTQVNDAGEMKFRL